MARVALLHLPDAPHSLHGLCVCRQSVQHLNCPLMTSNTKSGHTGFSHLHAIFFYSIKSLWGGGGGGGGKYIFFVMMNWPSTEVVQVSQSAL